MPSTLDCLIERNFLYDSCMMGNDFSPYYCRVGDQAPADGPFIVLKVTPRAIACRIDALPVPGALREAAERIEQPCTPSFERVARFHV